MVKLDPALLGDLDAAGDIEGYRRVVEEADRRPLWTACFYGHVNAVTALLPGVPPEAPARSKRGKRIETMVSVAARNGHAAVVELLLQAGHGSDLLEALVLAISTSQDLRLIRALVDAVHAAQGGLDRAMGYGLPTPLIAAIQAGNLEVCELILDRQPKFRGRLHGKSVMGVAAQGGNLEIARLLLARNALQERTWTSPLVQAAAAGHLQMVELLLTELTRLDRCDERDMQRALCAAGSHGHTEVFDFLLDAVPVENLQLPVVLREVAGGASDAGEEVVDAGRVAACRRLIEELHCLPDAGSFERAAKSGSVALLELFRDQYGVRPHGRVIELAATKGHTDALKFLTASEFAPEHIHQALLGAVQGGHTECVRVLLALPGDISGATEALREAVRRGHVEVATLLLEQHGGVDVNAQFDGDKSALHLASAPKLNLPMIRLLLAHGADAAQRDGRGQQPVMLAAVANSVEAVRLLVDHGADPTAARSNGITPLFAVLAQHKPLGSRPGPVARLLLQLGADPQIPAQHRCSDLGLGVQKSCQRFFGDRERVWFLVAAARGALPRFLPPHLTRAVGEFL